MPCLGWDVSSKCTNYVLILDDWGNFVRCNHPRASGPPTSVRAYARCRITPQKAKIQSDGSTMHTRCIHGRTRSASFLIVQTSYQQKKTRRIHPSCTCSPTWIRSLSILVANSSKRRRYPNFRSEKVWLQIGLTGSRQASSSPFSLLHLNPSNQDLWRRYEFGIKFSLWSAVSGLILAYFVLHY